MRTYFDNAIPDSHRIGGDLFRERRRSATIGKTVLPAVPGTDDAAIDDPPFADRSVR